MSGDTLDRVDALRPRLERLDADDRLAELERALADDDGLLRVEAAEILSESIVAGGEVLLRRTIGAEADPLALAFELSALAFYRAPEDLPLLLSHLQHDDRIVRVHAGFAIAVLGVEIGAARLAEEFVPLDSSSVSALRLTGELRDLAARWAAQIGDEALDAARTFGQQGNEGLASMIVKELAERDESAGRD